jgi:radical SAM protein with 4Fe4S-binding SPASM domain
MAPQDGLQKALARRTPHMVIWNFTNVCNLKCKHCYQNAGPETTPDELTLAEKMKLIDALVDAGVKVPVLSGGEPLIHTDFWPVLDRLSEKGMHVGVATNAVTLTKDVAQRLKTAGLGYIEISLDSVHPETHDEFRGVPGSWERTVQGIKNCIEAKIFTAVAMVVTKQTLGEVDEMLELASGWGANRFIHFNFVPTGRAPGIKEQDPSPEERDALLRKLAKRRRTAGLEVLSTAPQYNRVCLEQSLGEEIDPYQLYVETRSAANQFYIEAPTYYEALANAGRPSVPLEAIKGCGAGRQFCCIQPNGDITPCMFIPTWKFGNVRQTPFRDIWVKLGEERSLWDREALEPHCGKCQFRYLCGGCRGRAYNYHNNPFAADTGCLRNLQKTSSPSSS